MLQEVIQAALLAAAGECGRLLAVLAVRLVRRVIRPTLPRGTPVNAKEEPVSTFAEANIRRLRDRLDSIRRAESEELHDRRETPNG